MISAMFGRAGVRIAVAAALSLYLGTAHAEEQKVTIDNFTFSPATLKVKVGDTVTWTNHDDIPHTVRAVDGSMTTPAAALLLHSPFAFPRERM